MINKTEQAQVLAALSTIPHSQADVSDQQLADFVAGNLSDEEHARLLATLAHNPHRLHEAVLANEALTQSLATPPRLTQAQTWLDKIKQSWLLLTTSSGIGLAALAYFVFAPALLVSDIETQLSQSYSMAKFDLKYVSDNLTMSKSFSLSPSQLKEDVDYGVNAVHRSLGINVPTFIARECISKSDCEKQAVAMVLGKWLGLNTIQCQSGITPQNNYWLQQAQIFNDIESIFSTKGFTTLSLEPISINTNNKLKGIVCETVDKINNAKY